MESLLLQFSLLRLSDIRLSLIVVTQLCFLSFIPLALLLILANKKKIANQKQALEDPLSPPYAFSPHHPQPFFNIRLIRFWAGSDFLVLF